MIGFAHRGMRGRAPDNSVAGYRMALAAGATALEGDVWPTADGEAMLDHDGVVGSGPFRRQIPDIARADLPDLDSLADLYRACGAAFELSLDVKHAGALEPVLAAADQVAARDRLWLCHPDWRLVASWRPVVGGARLVDSTRIRRIGEGVEERARRLAEAGVDALNLPYPEWTPAAVEACHRHDVRAFAWHAHDRQSLEAMVSMGVDAVFSDDVETMVAVLAGA